MGGSGYDAGVAEREARQEKLPCLMLVPRGFDVPQDLLGGLEARGVELEEVGDAPAVMVALARQRYLSIVIVEPEAVLELEPLLEAVGRYHGPVPVWQYVAENRPRLSRLAPEAAAAGEPSSAEQPAFLDDTPAQPRVAGRIGPAWQGRRRRTPAPVEAECTGPAERRKSRPGDGGEGGGEPPAGEADFPGAASTRPAVSATDNVPEVRVTLSEEELSMLLGGSDDEEGRR